MTQLASRGSLARGDSLLATSWCGSSFIGKVDEVLAIDGKTAFKVSTSSPGWVTARTQIVVDLDDPLTPAHGLEALLTKTINDQTP